MDGSLFSRIVCGVDGSPQSLEAVRQADVLLDPEGSLLLVAVIDAESAIHFQVAPTAWHAARRALDEVEALDAAAARSLEQALSETTRDAEVTTREVGGRPAASLVETAALERATLLAVGTHGLGRTAGILLGSAATHVLHEASCSVLVARAPDGVAWAPRSVVLGDDGSASAAEARRACDALVSRFGAALETITVSDGRPAHALVEAAATADLLVVGRRGARPALGLGSVSEHVAHHAPCSVLVVQGSASGDPA
jgi:nucleotide-binding universal stress UspA family protein